MLFKLKDTEVLEITPIYKDEHYEEGWCETCGENGLKQKLKSKLFLAIQLHIFTEIMITLKLNQLLQLLTIYSLT